MLKIPEQTVKFKFVCIQQGNVEWEKKNTHFIYDETPSREIIIIYGFYEKMEGLVWWPSLIIK